MLIKDEFYKNKLNKEIDPKKNKNKNNIKPDIKWRFKYSTSKTHKS